MLLTRARNGGWKESNIGGLWVSINAASRGSEFRRWRRAASTSPSLDNGLMIFGNILEGWLGFLLLDLVMPLEVVRAVEESTIGEAS